MITVLSRLKAELWMVCRGLNEMEQVTVHVEVEVNPTENEANVKAAVSNVFGNLKFTCQPAGKQDLIIADAKSQDSLVKLRNILRSDRIQRCLPKSTFPKHPRRNNPILPKQASSKRRTH